MKTLLTLTVFAALAFAPMVAQADAGTDAWKAGKCAKCHGDDGKAQTKIGKKKHIIDMSSAEWQASITDDQIKTAIREGIDRKKDGKKQKMKPFKGVTDAQVEDLLKLIRSYKI